MIHDARYRKKDPIYIKDVGYMTQDTGDRTQIQETGHRYSIQNTGCRIDVRYKYRIQDTECRKSRM